MIEFAPDRSVQKVWDWYEFLKLPLFGRPWECTTVTAKDELEAYTMGLTFQGDDIQ